MPGLALAAEWPDSRWLLVEAGQRRAAFLTGAIGRLGFAHVEVRRCRAELVGREDDLRAQACLVTARGFGPPAVTAECAAPLLAVDGLLVVSEPPEGEERWPTAGLAILGLGAAQAVGGPAHYVAAAQTQRCPTRYPRRVGIPAKRPLW